MLFQRNEQRLLVHTPAKLNLYLEIIGRRDDGFHELETFMVSVDLYDTLRFQVPRDHNDLSLTVCSQVPGDIPADERNLVLKAAELLRERAGCAAGAEIALLKRIPVQAGLGGGSSDAAAALVGLNDVWALGLSRRELHELAAELGSDVNFFLEQTRAAVCRGRGELVQPVKPGPQLHFVVSHPGFGLSTADVFRACSISDCPSNIEEFTRGFLRGHTSLHNRLSAAAVSLEPGLGELAEAFVGPNGMTGSGSAWFEVAKSRRTAVRRANLVRSRFPLGITFAASMNI